MKKLIDATWAAVTVVFGAIGIYMLKITIKDVRRLSARPDECRNLLIRRFTPYNKHADLLRNKESEGS